MNLGGEGVGNVFWLAKTMKSLKIIYCPCQFKKAQKEIFEIVHVAFFYRSKDINV